MVLLALAAAIVIQAPEEALLDGFRTAIESGNAARVKGFFGRPEWAGYLLESAERRGLRNFRAHMIAAPPGRTSHGAYWMIVSTRQDIEEDHDLVLPVIRTGDGFKLGQEIPEWEPDPFRIRHAEIRAKLFPKTSSILVQTKLEMATTTRGVAPIFRLGLPYGLLKASADGKELNVLNAGSENVVRPKEGDAVKAGGLLAVWSPDPSQRFQFDYSGVIRSEREDKIADHVAYVTAFWVPSIGRRPHTTETTVTGPMDWVLVSEGESQGADSVEGDGSKTARFKCEVPISYPKIVGGRYTLAAEIVDGNRKWRSYQLEPVDKGRAELDAKKIQAGVKWFEERFGPFPFTSYACFDADTYYGIESYSYTLLQRGITTRFVTHEIGHTYFGGLVPCTYTRDTWNESVTQYVDSVLYQNNADRSLEAGLQTIQVAVPLSKMGIAHAFGSATYYRGAYVLSMLEREIGREAMIKSLRKLVETRRGVETDWLNIRPIFESVSGVDLKRFWEEWVTNADFPTIAVTDVRTVSIEGKPRSWVTVRQTGSKILRCRLKVVLRRYSQRFEKEIVLDGNQATVPIDAPFEPTEAVVEVFGLSLARTGSPWKL